MNRKLESIWYSNKKNNGLMLLSFIYRWIIGLQHCLYRLGIKKVVRLQVPVIVIGNLTVGGTGKTPLTICLAKYLMEEGYQVGIVSRGYKGSYTSNFQRVHSESTPVEVGDEAVLMARNLNCPVVVARKRVTGALFLQNELGCNVILSDDGLQHYALGRDIEIIVIDGQRKFGNGLCLPAGPLREPTSRVREADFCIINTPYSRAENFLLYAKSGDAYSMQLVPMNWKNLKKPSLRFNKKEGEKVHAVAGIGHPDRFFNQLTQMGFQVVPHTFPDHYRFKKEDFNFNDDIDIVMTEKDAVKCMDFADERYWCLPVEASLSPEFQRLFISKVGGIFKNH